VELDWDREKLKYVHLVWPQYEEDVILRYEDNNKYQMVGVIRGKQFGGEWIRKGGLLPHLGINKPPVTYIHATKRGTSPSNPKQGKWYLCLDDNYVSYFKPKELTNNFQDVLLYMDNDHRRTYRPQLMIFQKIHVKDKHMCNLSPPSSPVKIDSYEPNLQKKTLVEETRMVHPYPYLGLTNQSPLTSRVVKRKNAWTKSSRFPPSHKSIRSKKKLLSVIDMILEASEHSEEAEEKRYFGYDKQSDYPKGPSGFQIQQTEDRKRYYASLANLKKK
jgi:hypothetical protein